MKKEKSKVILNVLILVIGIMLVLITFFQNKYTNCSQEINDLSINRNFEIYNNLQETQFIWLLQVYSMIKNISYVEPISPDSMSIYTEPEYRNISQKYMRQASETQQKIFNFNNLIKSSSIKCNKYLNWIQYSTFITLFLYLITLLLGFAILQLYKT